MHGDRKRPLYGISVAADLDRRTPQSLRVYEAKGTAGALADRGRDSSVQR